MKPLKDYSQLNSNTISAVSSISNAKSKQQWSLWSRRKTLQPTKRESTSVIKQRIAFENEEFLKIEINAFLASEREKRERLNSAGNNEVSSTQNSSNFVSN